MFFVVVSGKYNMVGWLLNATILFFLLIIVDFSMSLCLENILLNNYCLRLKGCIMHSFFSLSS